MPQEVQADQTLPIGRIGNPESMDHPKDQPLCLVLDFLGHVLLMFCSCVFVERVSEKIFYRHRGMGILLLTLDFMDVSKNWGILPSKWMVKTMETPIKMDDLGGIPIIFGNIHIPKKLLSIILAVKSWVNTDTNCLRGRNPRPPLLRRVSAQEAPRGVAL